MQEEANLALSWPCYTATQKLEIGKILPPFPINLHGFIYISIFLLPKVIVLPCNNLKYLTQTKNLLPSHTWFSSLFVWVRHFMNLSQIVYFIHMLYFRAVMKRYTYKMGNYFNVADRQQSACLETPVAQNIHNYLQEGGQWSQDLPPILDHPPSSVNTYLTPGNISMTSLQLQYVQV